MQKTARGRSAACKLTAMYTHIQVENNDNSLMSADQVYKNLSEPFPVVGVRIYEGEPGGTACAVTGWSSENDGSPVEAYAVQVEDSSEGSAYVLYGGDWGVRLRPAESGDPWSLDNPKQSGETHLVLADREDLTEGRS